MSMPLMAWAQWRDPKPLGYSTPPPVALESFSGGETQLAFGNGKVYLVNFWATWCEPCRDEFPLLLSLARTHEKNGLEVVFINLSEGRARIQEFMTATGMRADKLNVLLDKNGSVYKAFKARGLPASFLVGRKGQVLGYWLGDISRLDDPAFDALIQSALKP